MTVNKVIREVEHNSKAPTRIIGGSAKTINYAIEG
jgi:hypothetical protein